eukprot:Nitzschia sp. Nitz4//scaffold141_size107518//8369//9373//NITZ4_004264-RA/size107518-processed-gene-0.77-mRNA-1//1//CDS//3329536252//4419//frame0
MTFDSEPPTLSGQVDGSLLRERLRAYGLEGKTSCPRHDTLRRASVLIIVSNDNQILLTQRTLHLKSHPGEVCFPGGKQDPEDGGDDWVTGLREALEEVGLDLNDKLERLCTLPTTESKNHLCVTPLVGYVNESAAEMSKKIQINPSEVELFFWVPLQFFVNRVPDESWDIHFQGETFVYRRYQYELDNNRGELPITGLTANMARDAALVAFPPTPPEPVPHTLGERHGSLWRLHATDTTKPFWSRKYFVLTDGVLHQYDNGRMAHRKAQSATKKNRLLLQKDSFEIHDDDERPDDRDRHCFRISTLEGRVVWQLAASSKEDLQQWKGWLLDVAQ